MHGPAIFTLLDCLASPTGRPRCAWAHAALHAAGIGFFALTVSTRLLDSGLVRSAVGWSYVVPRSPLPLLYDAFVGACVLPGMLMLWAAGSRSGHPAAVARARIVTLTGGATLVLIYVVDRLPHILDLVRMPSTSHVLLLIWMGGIAWSIARHSLFTISPELAAGNIVETMTDCLILCGEDSRIMRVNRMAEQVLGRAGSELVGSPLGEVFGSDELLGGDLAARLHEQGPFHDREVRVGRDGAEVVLSVSASAVADRYGRVTGCVAILRDITGRKRSEEELRYMATHDPLTKLPNRTLFGDRAAQAMARARRYRHFVGVMLVDLDRFKQVNDTLGHETGDRLLKAVAARLRSLVRDSDTVARLGGDEFVVLATDLPAPETASIVADRLIDALSRPVPVGDRSIDVSASIGASVFPGDGETFDELPARSDVALYRAKENWGTVAFHSAV